MIEPRSNSMKLGAHRDGLPESVAQADQVIWYAPPNLGWDLGATATACPVPAVVCDSLERSSPGSNHRWRLAPRW